MRLVLTNDSSACLQLLSAFENHGGNVMKRNPFVLLAAIFVVGLSAARGPAQYVPGSAPGRRPALSPYLNLDRPGNPGINYYGLVRPQFQVQGALQKLSNSVNSLESNQAPAQDIPLQTGHASSFMTQSKYFMTNAAGNRGSNRGTGGNRGTVNPPSPIRSSSSRSSTVR